MSVKVSVGLRVRRAWCRVPVHYTQRAGNRGGRSATPVQACHRALVQRQRALVRGVSSPDIRLGGAAKATISIRSSTHAEVRTHGLSIPLALRSTVQRAPHTHGNRLLWKAAYNLGKGQCARHQSPLGTSTRTHLEEADCGDAVVRARLLEHQAVASGIEAEHRAPRNLLAQAREHGQDRSNCEVLSPILGGRWGHRIHHR